MTPTQWYGAAYVPGTAIGFVLVIEARLSDREQLVALAVFIALSGLGALIGAVQERKP